MTHGFRVTVLRLPNVVKNHVFDEDGDGLQDEGHEQVHVDVVPRAVQLSVSTSGKRALNIGL